MWVSRRAVLALCVSAVAALSLSLAVGAFGDRGHGRGGDRSGFEQSLAPSVPADPAFHGVTPGGAPWVMRRGEAKVSDGRLDLRVRGLVIPVAPGNGTPGPVTTISASLYCGADSVTAPADTSGQAPISRRGLTGISSRRPR